MLHKAAPYVPSLSVVHSMSKDDSSEEEASKAGKPPREKKSRKAKHEPLLRLILPARRQ